MELLKLRCFFCGSVYIGKWRECWFLKVFTKACFSILLKLSIVLNYFAAFVYVCKKDSNSEKGIFVQPTCYELDIVL